MLARKGREMESFRDLLVETEDMADILLYGLPFDQNASVGKGASKAPDRLRFLSGFLPALTKDGYLLNHVRLFDEGNADKLDYSVLRAKSLSLLEKKKFVLFIGGDHSVNIGTVDGFISYCQKVNKKPGLIHIDAHPDICDEYEGSHFSHATPVRRAIDNGIATEDICLIGIRGYEEQEVIYFASHPEIKIFNASFILENGPQKVIDYLNEKFNDDYLVYLSYDIDANDPAFAPGTGTPEAFGPKSTDLLAIILSAFKHLPIKMMDLVEISPPLDNNDITSWLGLKTLYEIFYVLQQKKETL